jgi:hypothetical protein
VSGSVSWRVLDKTERRGEEGAVVVRRKARSGQVFAENKAEIIFSSRSPIADRLGRETFQLPFHASYPEGPSGSSDRQLENESRSRFSLSW